MESSTSQLLQSRYFSPVFNTAIFDGAFRVYFSQNQEPEALKLYMKLQDRFKKTKREESDDRVVFIMLYPNAESFAQVFEGNEETRLESLGSDIVLGIKGPCNDDLTTKIETRLSELSFI